MKTLNMAVKKHGQGTAQSIIWGSPSPFVKTQDGGNPIDECNMPDVPPRPYLIRFGSWNIGTMTGKSSEVVEVLEKQRVDVCCVQET